MRIGIITLSCALLLAVPTPAPADDMAGDSATLAPLPDAEWTVDKAAHLLRRAGFGGTLEEIRELHGLGVDAAIDRLLAWDGKPDPKVRAPGITVTSRPGRAEMAGLMDQEARQMVQREYRRKDRMQYVKVREWWLQAMVTTDWPLRERLVLFWHGHFTSSYRDVRNSYHMYIQNTLLRRHAAGNFRTLLHEISKDPAMLEYLDNRSNRKGHPNENYAREVMELFTLGVGNYTEEDIKEAARALTGWTSAGNRFYFDERQHDADKKTFLGRTGNFGGDEVLDIMLDQPAASRYIATRLYHYFAHDFPDKRVIEGLARTLRENKWELKPALRQLLRSRAFYSKYAVGTKIKSPVDYVVSLHKSLGLKGEQAFGLSIMAETLGQSVMEPPNVKGWPGGRDWVTTSMLLQRYNVAGMVVGLPQDKMRTLRGGGKGYKYMRMLEQMRRTDPNGEEMDGMGDGMDDAGKKKQKRRRGRRGRRALPPSYDVLGAVRARSLTTPDEIVSFYARSLLASPLTPDMRETLVEYLTRDGGFGLDRMDAKARLHGLLRLIVSTPEFQLS